MINRALLLLLFGIVTITFLTVPAYAQVTVGNHEIIIDAPYSFPLSPLTVGDLNDNTDIRLELPDGASINNLTCSSANDKVSVEDRTVGPLWRN